MNNTRFPSGEEKTPFVVASSTKIMLSTMFLGRVVGHGKEFSRFSFTALLMSNMLLRVERSAKDPMCSMIAIGSSGIVVIAIGSSGIVVIAIGSSGIVVIAIGSSGIVVIAIGSSGIVVIAIGSSGIVVIAIGSSGIVVIAIGSSGIVVVRRKSLATLARGCVNASKMLALRFRSIVASSTTTCTCGQVVCGITGRAAS